MEWHTQHNIHDDDDNYKQSNSDKTYSQGNAYKVLTNQSPYYPVARNHTRQKSNTCTIMMLPKRMNTHNVFRVEHAQCIQS